MNKSELINAVAVSAEVSKKEAEAVITAALDAITAALKEGDKVQLVGFGSFEVKKRAARVGRNPKTKEAIEIPASVVPPKTWGWRYTSFFATPSTTSSMVKRPASDSIWVWNATCISTSPSSSHMAWGSSRSMASSTS